MRRTGLSSGFSNAGFNRSGGGSYNQNRWGNNSRDNNNSNNRGSYNRAPQQQPPPQQPPPPQPPPQQPPPPPSYSPARNPPGIGSYSKNSNIPGSSVSTSTPTVSSYSPPQVRGGGIREISNTCFSPSPLLPPILPFFLPDSAFDEDGPSPSPGPSSKCISLGCVTGSLNPQESTQSCPLPRLEGADSVVFRMWRQALRLMRTWPLLRDLQTEQLQTQFQFSDSQCSDSGMHRPLSTSMSPFIVQPFPEYLSHARPGNSCQETDEWFPLLV